jgi:hypothetical protein
MALDAIDETTERENQDVVAARKELFLELGRLEDNCGHVNESCGKEQRDEMLKISVSQSKSHHPPSSRK